jgi:hypothetical protein
MGKPAIYRAVALDERLAISYLASMATRLVLTLLALLTGLAAQLSPAQARICAGVDTEIGEVSGTSIAQRRSAAAVLAHPPIKRLALHEQAAPGLVPARVALAVPGVLQGIDRARE